MGPMLLDLPLLLWIIRYIAAACQTAVIGKRGGVATIVAKIGITGPRR